MNLGNVTAVMDPPLQVDVKDVDYNYDFSVCILLIPAGIFLWSLGPKFTQFSMVLLGFAFGLSTGSDVGYFLTGKHIIAFGVGAGFGLFLAALMACIHASMYLVLGGMTAFLVFNYAGAPLIEEVASPTPVTMGIGLGISAIIGGLVAHFFRKWVVMILSVFFGSYFLVNGIGGLAEHYRFNWIWIFYTRPKFVCDDSLCYAFYGTWASLFLLGVLIHTLIARCTKEKNKDDDMDTDEEDEEEEREREREKRRRQRRRNKKRRSKRSSRRDSDYSSEDVSEDEKHEMKKLKRKKSGADIESDHSKEETAPPSRPKSGSERGIFHNMFASKNTKSEDIRVPMKDTPATSSTNTTPKSKNPFDQYDDDSVV